MVLLGLLWAGPLQAADNSWTKTALTNYWDTDANWSANVAPSSNFGTIWITNALTKVVLLDFVAADTPSMMTISNLTIAGVGAGTNTLSMETFSATPLRVINNLTLNAGGVFKLGAAHLRVESGVFNVNGGVLQQGGTITSGYQTVIGNTGNGTLTLQSGSFVQSSGTFALGFNAGSTGVVTQSGGLLIVTNSETHIGVSGSGQMTLNGGTFLGKDLFLGYLVAGSSGTLTLAGGTNRLTGELRIGRYGTGNVWLQSGQLVVTNADTSIGRAGIGQMTISNGTFLGQNVYLGYLNNAVGTLNLAGGSATVANLTIANALSATGTVNITGGQLTAGGTLNVGANGYGHLNMSGGTVLAQQLLATNGSNSRISFNGGTLVSQSTTFSNGAAFIIGETGGSATFKALGGTHNFQGNLLVGFLGNDNQLLISNAATVFNSDGFIGFASSASNNAVTVTGAGSVWSNSGDLNVGSQGKGNTLTIANGGAVRVGHDLTISSSIGVSNNSLTITGGQLTVTNGVLNLSPGGSGYLNMSGGTVLAQQLLATNGPDNIINFNGGTLVSQATIFSNGEYFIIGDTGGNATFQALGGTHNFQAGLVLGNFSSGNQLLITNAATVYNSYGHIGSEASASNNAVTVSGAGSIWSNRNDLFVGEEGSGNTLTITNRATVYSGRDASIGVGFSSGASNNAVIVTGAGSVWDNHGNLYLGNFGCGNTLTMASGGAVYNDSSYIGGSGGRNNAVTVSGAGSVWSNRNDLRVGFVGCGNTLTITNGGAVYSDSGIIGYWAGGSNNAVTVTGSGSVWDNRGDLVVGRTGAGNTLTITNGGAVRVGTDLTISSSAGASNNALTIAGGQLTVTNGALDVGPAGLGTLNMSGGTVLAQQLLATNGSRSVINLNGGTLISQGTTVSNGSDFIIGDTGGNATFKALGGTHSFQGNLVIGDSSSGNQLLITNAADVISSHGYIGYNSSASNNAATVTGAGSVWSNSGEVVIGVYGAGNRLNIANGGKVYNSSGGDIGAYSSASNNAVTVTGAGSVWDIRLNLEVGHNGADNTLTIANGGKVYSGYHEYLGADGYIGAHSGASNNAVTVTGVGSVWDNNRILYVGLQGGGNKLTIANGGTVVARDSEIGVFSSSSNAVTVTGSGSIWSNRADLIVGGIGACNSLTITNGGAVFNANSASGSDFRGQSNAVTVTGPGSLWSNSGDLTIGYAGSGNSLTIANSGIVNNSIGNIGRVAGAQGNAVTVTGPGSVWSNRNDLYIGNFGAGNTLTITNSGVVYAQNVYLANNPGSSGTLTLSGGTLAASNLVIKPSGVFNYNPGTLQLSGALQLTGGTLNLGTLLALGSGGASTSAVQLLSGTLGIMPTGTLRLGADIPSTSVAVLNQGVLQVLASTFSFNGGLDNQSAYTVAQNQAVTVQHGLANSGGLMIQPAGTLSVDAVVEQVGNLFIFNAAQLAVGSAWTNAGPISIQAGYITGGKLNNSDLIEGFGAISAPVNNLAGGTVRASGGLLALNGSSIQNQSGAALEIESGATLRLARSLDNAGVVNNLGGILSMASSVLTNNGVVTGYGSFKPLRTINNGQMLFQGGQSDIYGAYLNAATTTVSHATANFFGAVTNQAGALFKNTGGVVTYFGALYNDGTILSDPATNIYAATLTLGPSGVLEGGVGDRFEFHADLVSSNPVGLKLQASEVAFTDGAHLLALSGVTAFGTLNLSAGASLTLDGADLYVGLFDATTNQLTTAWTIFYDPAQNPSLESKTYNLTGGGFLTIPEPGTIGLVMLMGLGFYYGRRVRRWRR
jgi:T5SS/PEP-CTERM-associated repeat protein